MQKNARLGGSGGMLPREINCSESASEAILGQKQSRSSYHGSRSTASKFWLSTYAFSKPSNFHERRYTTNIGRTAGRATSLEGQLPSAWTSNLFMHVFARILHRSGINSLRTRSVQVLNEQTCIVATRLVWTAVILNSSETSHGRTLKMYS